MSAAVGALVVALMMPPMVWIAGVNLFKRTWRT